MWLNLVVITLLTRSTLVYCGESKHQQQQYNSLPSDANVEDEFDCRMLEDGLYPDQKKACSEMFYVCTGGSVSSIPCPKNTYYDQTNQRCDNWDNVFECSGQHATKPSEDAATTPKTVNFQCTANGEYADVSTPCSTKYIQCVHGVAYERECSPGSYYDPDEMQCDMHGNIFACTGVKKELTTTMAPADVTPHVVEFDCSNKEDGMYLEEATDNACFNFYFVCDNKIDHKIYCPTGTYFDNEYHACDIWRHVFACSGLRRPTPPSQDLATYASKVDFDCNGKEDGDYANPRKTCDRIYYSCSGEVASERQCADGSFFDSELLLCDEFDNVPDCTGHARVLTTTPEPRDIPVYSFDCSQKAEGIYPAGDCKDGYWSCVGGMTSEIKCQKGLYYDSELMLCEKKEFIPSCGGVRPTHVPLDVTSESSVLPVDCSVLPDGSYPDPADRCAPTFYICDERHGTKMDCPDKLYFDPDRQVCDWKKYIIACGGQPTLPPFDCSSLPDGSYPDPNVHDRCSSTFFVCDDHNPTRLSCTDKRFFDPDRQICDWKKYIVACGGRPKSQQNTKQQKTKSKGDEVPLTKKNVELPLPKKVESSKLDLEQKAEYAETGHPSGNDMPALKRSERPASKTDHLIEQLLKNELARKNSVHPEKPTSITPTKPADHSSVNKPSDQEHSEGSNYEKSDQLKKLPKTGKVSKDHPRQPSPNHEAPTEGTDYEKSEH